MNATLRTSLPRLVRGEDRLQQGSESTIEGKLQDRYHAAGAGAGGTKAEPFASTAGAGAPARSTDPIRAAISTSPPELLDVAAAGANVIGTRWAMNSLILGIDARSK